MKTISLAILLLTVSFVFGQTSNTIFNTGSNDLKEWTRDDFIDNNVKKICAYSYKINKKGRVKKDSLLLFKQEFDARQNIIFGLNSSIILQSSGPTFLSFYKFQIYFNRQGLITKEINEPLYIEKEKSFGCVDYDINIDETEHEYDSLNREIKRTYKQINHSYSIDKFPFSRDTSHWYTIHQRINEFFYNENGQEIYNYYTDDSTRRLPTKSYKLDSNSVWCSYCDPTYLREKREYYENGNLKLWTSYTRDSKIQSKKYYFYDKNLNLINQIDSTGWYFTTIEPYWESTTTFQYLDTGKIETKIHNTNQRFAGSRSKEVTFYNNQGRTLSYCYYDKKGFCDHQYLYLYNNNKVTELALLYKGKISYKIEYCYNKNGLLTEVKTIRNDLLTELIRYYYE